MSRHLAALSALVLAACSVDLNNLPCTTDGECQTGAYCSNGKCAVGPVCTAPAQLCHDKCTDTTQDASNCGVCGMVCTAPAGGSANCVASQCVTTPGAVAVTGLSVQSSSAALVALEWTAVSAASSYDILRSTDGSSYSALGTSANSSYQDTTVEPGTRYWYEVKAVVSGTTGPASQALQATTPLAVPTHFTANPLSYSSVTLGWQASTNASGYIVFVSTDGTTFNPYNSQTPTTTDVSFMVGGLAPGTEYYFVVAAWNQFAQSPQSAAVTQATPLVPPVLSLTASSPTSASFAWSASQNATSYTLARRTDPQGAYSTVRTGNILSATDTGLTVGTTYYYLVSAQNSIATDGEAGAVLTFVPMLDTPQGLQITVLSSTAVSATWTSLGSEATGYNVQYSLDGAAWTGTSASPTSSTNTAQITGLPPGTTLLFRVQAVSGSVLGPFSAAVSATTLLAPPTLSSAIPTSSTSVSLSWSGSPNATQYLVTAMPVGGAALAAMQTTNTQLNYSGLQPGTSYSFVVAAHDSATGSLPSNSLSAITPLDAPQLSSSNLTGTSVTLNWTAPTNATVYLVSRAPAGGAFTPNPMGTQSTTTANDTSIMPGGSYAYEVSASNATFTSGTLSNVVNITAPFASPAGLTASPISSGAAQVSWSGVASATGYNLQRSTNGGAYTPVGPNTPTTNSTNYNDTGVTSGTQVTYQVQSYDGFSSGFSGPSTPIIIPLDPPGNVQAVLGTDMTSINVTWQTNPFATGYIILRANYGTTSYSPVGTSSGSSGQYTDSGLPPGSTYTYEIEATTSVATSLPSTGNMSSSAAIPLQQPVLTVTGTSSTSVSFSWATVTNATSYQLGRQSGSGLASVVGTFGPTATSATDATAMQGTLYSYFLTAKDSATNIQSTSATVQATTPLDTPMLNPLSYTAGSGVSASWSTSTNASNYTFQRSVDGGANWTGITLAVTQTVDSLAMPGGAYQYQVQATNAVAMSSFSAPLSITIPLGAVTGVTAPQVTPPQVTLSWNATTGASGYIVLRSVDNATFTPLGSTPSTTGTTFVDGTVLGGHTVYYEVEAWTANTTGPASTPSLQVNVPLAAPSPLSAGYDSSFGKIKLSWGSSPGASSYTVQRSIDSLTWSGGTGTTATSYFDSPTAALDGSIIYYYRVQASAGTVLSVFSESAAAYIPLAAPQNLSETSPSPGVVNLSWQSVPAATGYNVYRSSDSGMSYSLLAQDVSTASVADDTCAGGLTYDYYVEATARGTVGPASLTVGASCQGAVTPPLTGLHVTSSTVASISLAWNTPDPTPQFYQMLRSTDGLNFSPTGPGVSFTNFTDLTSGVTPGSAVWYQVEGTDGGVVTAAPSATVAASYAQLYPPATVSAFPGPTGTGVSWSPVADVTGYTVFSSADGVSWAVISDDGGTATSYTDTQAPPGNQVYYTVQSDLGSSSSPYANSTSAATDIYDFPPTNLVLAAAATCSSIALSWTPPASAAPPADGLTYWITRTSTAPNGNTMFLTTSPTFTDYTVMPGNNYGYQVQVYGPDFHLSMPAPPQGDPPLSVSTLTTALSPPGSVAAEASSSSMITVSWTPPSGAAPSGYSLIRSTDGTSYSVLGAAPPGNEYIDVNVLPGTRYYYQVQADYSGQPSGPLSGAVQAETSAVTPIGLVAAGSAAQVTLNWTASAGTLQYSVSRGSASGGPPFDSLGNPFGTDWTDRTVVAGTTYTYFVQAQNSGPAEAPAQVVVTADATGVSGSFIDTYENNGAAAKGAPHLRENGKTYNAQVLQTDGSLSTIPGLTSSDGYFTIGNVPQGYYYLWLTGRVGRVWTNLRSFDLGRELEGRQALVPLSMEPTNLILDLNNLGPWASTDLLEVIGLGALLELYNPQTGGTALGGPLPSYTSTNSMIVDAAENGFGLLTPADTIYATQLETLNSSTNLPYLAVTHSFIESGLTEVDGQPLTIGGANANGAMTDLQAAGAGQTQTINWQRSAFKSHLVEMNPAAQNAAGDYIALDAMPGVDTVGYYSNFGSPDLFYDLPPLGTSNLDFGTVQYWNPYPTGTGGWDLFGILGVYGSMSYLYPGATTAILATGSITYQDSAANFLPNLQTGTFGPPLTPVTSPTIDGQSLFLDNSNVGVTPTIVWQLPAVGTPSYYVVTLTTLTASHGATIVDSVSRFTTQQTSLTVPLGFLTLGEPAYATISAFQTSGYSPATPNQPSITTMQADCLTNLFTP